MRATRSTALAAAVVTAALAGGSLVSVGTAQADPTGGAAAKQLVGVGSDTTQDVMNALAKNITVDGETVASWDAVPVGSTITTRTGGPAFLRPNNSGNGRKVLSDSLTNGSWSDGTATGHVAIGGQVDFARSSGTSNTSGKALIYIPFARDAVSYAALQAPGSHDLDSLTPLQLKEIYSGTLTAVGTTTVHPKLPPVGSGTRNFFLKAIGLKDSDVNWIDLEGPAGIVQENQADDSIKQVGDLAPFSVASWTAQLNGIAADHSKDSEAAGAFLGSVVFDGDTTATAPATKATTDGKEVWTPNQAFYDNGTFGRDVYNVVAYREIDPTSAFYKDALNKLFVSTGSQTAAVATDQAKATIASYGFLNVAYNGVLTSAHIAWSGLEDNAPSNTPLAPVVNSSAGNGSLALSWVQPAASAAADDYRVTVTGPNGQPLKDKAGKPLSNDDLLADNNTLAWSGLASGTYTVTVASYNLASSPGEGNAVTKQITVANRTATAISYSRALKVAYGYNERITAKVVPAPGTAVPTGTVQLLDGTRVVGSASLVKGVAVVNFLNPAYKPGLHSFTLKYLGDAHNLGSTTRVSFTVVKATPAERISFPTTVRHTRTSKIAVTLASPHTVPTGWVKIYDGKRLVGKGYVRNGKVVVTVAKLAKGKHKLRISYAGTAVLNATTRWVTVKSV